MNHDFTHCLDYKPSCPKECFRVQLAKDLELRQSKFKDIPLSFAHLEETEYCRRNGEAENDKRK